MVEGLLDATTTTTTTTIKHCRWLLDGYMAWCGSFAYLCLLLYIGVVLRKIAFIRLIFLPASLIAGLIGLCTRLIIEKTKFDYPSEPECNSYEIYTKNFTSFWGSVPSIAINIVFACLFLGRKLPSFQEIVDRGGPQLCYGQIKAWGNWFWCGAVGLVLVNTMDIQDIMISMMPVGFEGGHGTAGGLQKILGPQFYGLAVTSATIGIILGCVGGTVLVNWGVWRGHLHYQKLAKMKMRKEHLVNTEQAELKLIKESIQRDGVKPDSNRGLSHALYGEDGASEVNVWHPELTEPEVEEVMPVAGGLKQVAPLPAQYGDREAMDVFTKKPLTKRFKDKLATVPHDLYDYDGRPIAGHQTIRSEALDHLAFQLSHVGLSIFIGYALVRLLAMLDYTNENLLKYKVFSSFPLFPLCMVGGIIIEVSYKSLKMRNPCDADTMNMISGTSIEFLCSCAIATITVKASTGQFVAFFVILVTGFLWQMFCFFWLARRMLPDCWFERTIVEYGMSFGTTSIGLLLLRMADPLRQSTAWEAFSYKQMVHEPIMGGGLWTTFAVVFLTMFAGTDKETKYHLGIWIVFGSATGVIIIWFILFFLYFKPRFPEKDSLYQMSLSTTEAAGLERITESVAVDEPSIVSTLQ